MLNQAVHDHFQGNAVQWVVGLFLFLTHKSGIVLPLGECAKQNLSSAGFKSKFRIILFCDTGHFQQPGSEVLIGKLKRTGGRWPMKKLIIILLSLFALMSISSKAMAEESGLWKKTKTVVEWTVETSEKGWNATKEGASDVVEWTAEKSKKGWEATKEGTTDVVDWTAEKSKKGWESTKKGAGELAG
jgi:hypothetical protein